MIHNGEKKHNQCLHVQLMPQTEITIQLLIIKMLHIINVVIGQLFSLLIIIQYGVIDKIDGILTIPTTLSDVTSGVKVESSIDTREIDVVTVGNTIKTIVLNGEMIQKHEKKQLYLDVQLIQHSSINMVSVMMETEYNINVLIGHLSLLLLLIIIQHGLSFNVIFD